MMKYIKLFEAFSTPKPLTKRQINWLDKCAAGGWKLNPSTGLIDVDGDFKCTGQGLKDFKGVAFGHVEGDFYCGDNQLTSLEGAPKTVDESFDCGSNQLTSLEGAPKTVGGGFYCGDNQLTSLEEAPKTVDGSFVCSSNQLTSLVEGPQTVGGSFNCKSNQLTSLLGAPKTVGGDFDCKSNPLKSLEGAPERVGSFNISIWNSDPAIRTLDWDKGWNKGDVEFTKTLISKLKEINALGSDADKGKSISMLLSLTEPNLLDYLLSQNLSTSDKFEVYGAIKTNMPDVWYKLKDELDPEGATSDLLDLGF